MNSFVSAIKKISISLLFSSVASLALAYDVNLIRTVSVEDLPKEALSTLANIKKGGPFPYQKDGAVFGNFERILPQQRRGYYREYTVKTPRARNRGARRIVAGGEPKLTNEFYYTEDHYASFRKIKN
jgi:ribonuclease T1